MKYRLLFLSISVVVIVAGILSVLNWGLKFGLDFKGGTLIEYRLNNGQKKIERYGTLKNEDLEKIRADFKNQGAIEERLETVGPTIGPELVKKTIYGLLISTSAILFWIAYQFKSIKFGVSATIATFHDALVVIGVYSIFGHFFGAEIDFLFVTALLTIISFSVHDTIVVYDRIRELQKKSGADLKELANLALSETMVRSINNSFTIMFMLVALILMGGETTKWFAVALLVGTISGTYSSPFVAVPILVTWDEIQKKLKAKS
ncbi:MAG: protein translocase subunit SecF [Candidatus Woesebacteria bacterium]|nr:MAG: protein translocase subunit SecF [Candidatus Woesebacteria bacterium]